MPPNPVLAALAVSLQITPAPTSLRHTQHLLKYLQTFGSVTAFKVLRNPVHLPTFTRRLEALYQTPTAAESLRRAALTGSLKTEEGFEIRILEETWDHEVYIKRARGWMGLETGGVWGVKGSGVGGRGSGEGVERRWTGGFNGFKGMEVRG